MLKDLSSERARDGGCLLEGGMLIGVKSDTSSQVSDGLGHWDLSGLTKALKLDGLDLGQYSNAGSVMPRQTRDFERSNLNRCLHIFIILVLSETLNHVS